MTYDVAIEDFILMETNDKEEAITTMCEIINGDASIDATKAWVNVFNDDGEYVETIEAWWFLDGEMKKAYCTYSV